MGKRNQTVRDLALALARHELALAGGAPSASDNADERLIAVGKTVRSELFHAGYTRQLAFLAWVYALRILRHENGHANGHD